MRAARPLPSLLFRPALPRNLFYTRQLPALTVSALVAISAASCSSDGTGGNPPASLPRASAGADQTVAVGDSARFDGSASTGTGSTPPRFAWSVLDRPQGSVGQLANPAAARPAMLIDRAGEYRVELRVTTPTGTSADTVLVSGNSRPLADAGAAPEAMIADTVQLDGSRSADPEGSALTFAWTMLSRPSGSGTVIINPTTARASFLADSAGAYQVELRVSDGTVTGADTLTVTAAPFRLASVVAGEVSTCGLTSRGRLYCWGALPTGVARRPVWVARVLGFSSVTLGGDGFLDRYGCGLTTDNRAYCWGGNSMGQLGNGTRTDQEVSEPTPVAGGLRFAAVAAGGRHTCAVTAEGAAYCWGNNGSGQLGNGTQLSSTVPIAVSGGIKFKEVLASNASSCGRTAAGDIYCWGGSPDILGNGGPLRVFTTPVQSAQGQPWTALAVNASSGAQATCAVSAQAAAYCWGFNQSGKLGNGRIIQCYGGSPPCELTPVLVGGGHTWSSVEPGGSHSCGLTTAGDAYCWGLANHGQLGTEVSTTCETVGFPPACSFAPVRVSGGLRFASLSVGASHTCALTAAGDPYCWGVNGGRLGDGTDTNRAAPVRVAGP